MELPKIEINTIPAQKITAEADDFYEIEFSKRKYNKKNWILKLSDLCLQTEWVFINVNS